MAYKLATIIFLMCLGVSTQASEQNNCRGWGLQSNPTGSAALFCKDACPGEICDDNDTSVKVFSQGKWRDTIRCKCPLKGASRCCQIFLVDIEGTYVYEAHGHCSSQTNGCAVGVICEKQPAVYNPVTELWETHAACKPAN